MPSPDELLMRDATPDDLPGIVAMLADDMLGRGREAAVVDPAYERALAAITADANQRLVVTERNGALVGCFQLSFLPGIGRGGAWRAQIESVRVAATERGRGTGAAMMRWAIAQARERGCALVQLTTDKRREDAHRFYRRLGFEASHEGMKLSLS
jgi:GNAT superfamily N-acetyltransferase